MTGVERRFDLIVFDWDGTLLDSEAQIVGSFLATCTDLELAPPGRGAIRDIIGLGLHEALKVLFPAHEAVYPRIIECYRHHFFASRIPAPLFADALDTLTGLRAAGYLLGIATGKGRRGLERALTETGCAPLFHATRCADECPSKPHPQMLLELMEAVGAEPARSLMVGDTEYDMEMARNAGAAALAVSYGVHARERLLRHRPLACIDRLSELQGWLAPAGAATSGVRVGRAQKGAADV